MTQDTASSPGSARQGNLTEGPILSHLAGVCPAGTGVEVELHVWEAMPHGGFFGAPEDQEVFAERARFLRERLKG